MKVGIIGATGYTGGELLRILLKHRKVSEIVPSSRRLEGKRISSVHRSINLDMTFKSVKCASDCDFVFTATPNGVAMKIVPELLECGIKCVDLSADFRFKETSIYERVYGIKHLCPDIEAVYGIPEIRREEIRDSQLVANPGCYPTGAILLAFPIVDLFTTVIFDSKSGVSGAGAEPSKNTHFPEINESIRPYKVTLHRHLFEIRKELGDRKNIFFTPHMVPITRGILTTMHAILKNDVDAEDIRRKVERFYSDELFVRVSEDIPEVGAVRGSNMVHIGGFEKEGKRVVGFSAIDNLVKGASGQAIQNMNIMLGFYEGEGLTTHGTFP